MQYQETSRPGANANPGVQCPGVNNSHSGKIVKIDKPSQQEKQKSLPYPGKIEKNVHFSRLCREFRQCYLHFHYYFTNVQAASEVGKIFLAG